MVTISFNDRVPYDEAAQYLGCSKGAVMNYIKKGKLKAQKVQGIWSVEKADLEHAKATKLIKPRKRRSKKELKAEKIEKKMAVKIVKGTKRGEIVEFRIPCASKDISLLSTVLKNSGKTIESFIGEKLDELYEKVSASLRDIKI